MALISIPAAQQPGNPNNRRVTPSQRRPMAAAKPERRINPFNTKNGKMAGINTVAHTDNPRLTPLATACGRHNSAAPAQNTITADTSSALRRLFIPSPPIYPMYGQ